MTLISQSLKGLIPIRMAMAFLTRLKKGYCTNSNDADTDDDGILDGVEDANQNGQVDSGETNPCDIDSEQ